MSNTRKARNPETEQPETEAPALEVTDDDLVDFDAFWDEQEAAGKVSRQRVKIAGHIVTLPASLPLQFELEAKRLAKSKKDQDVKRLLAILLGDGEYAALVKAGMRLDHLKLLLAWAPQHLAGMGMTLAEVAEKVAAGEAEGADPT